MVDEPNASKRPAQRPTCLSVLVLCWLSLAVGGTYAVQGQQRSLVWPHLDVTAHLDAEGVLHVRETQTMVFDGVWNGGERTFNIERGRFTFNSLERFDPDQSTLRKLQRGDLSVVDQWDFTDRSTLRWRSRKPQDPAFDHQELVYVLDYSFDQILQPEGDEFLLSHDFAFRERDGNIELFTLHLELDPVWSSDGDVSLITKSQLTPGQGAVVRTRLQYTGDAPPRGVAFPRPAWIARLTYVLTPLLIAFLWFDFRKQEHHLERWSALPPHADMDRDAAVNLLEQWLPEELGALWDQKVGPPEVAALIARLVATKRLASEVHDLGRFRGKVLELKRLEDRSTFKGYEGKLERKLFYGNRRVVTTKDLRKHYRTSGLDLVQLIKGPIEERLSKAPPTKIPKRRTLVLLLGAGILGLMDVALRHAQFFRSDIVHALLFFYLLLTVLALHVPALAFSHRVRRSLSWAGRRSLGLLLAPALMLSLFAFLRWIFPFPTSPSLDVSLLGSMALALWIAALTSNLLNFARTRLESPEIASRRKIAQLRQWMANQLRQPEPDLQDEWFPVLIAFGLGPRIDRWFKAFGGAAASSSLIATSHLNSGSGFTSTGSSDTWTGGGGRFGGAGATAAWASAAAGLGAGVTAASSSSSGSGGGGGGGSSGGGGGGGW